DRSRAIEIGSGRIGMTRVCIFVATFLAQSRRESAWAPPAETTNGPYSKLGVPALESSVAGTKGEMTIARSGRSVRPNASAPRPPTLPCATQANTMLDPCADIFPAV